MSFYPAELVASTAETPLCQLITLAPPSELSASFTNPGQFVVLRAKPHQDGFFALANRVGSAHWEFLLKKSSSLSKHLASLKPGSNIELSAAQGQGYDVAKSSGKDVYLLCVGSGIAPIRSLLQYFLDRPGKTHPLQIYYGVHEPKEFAFARDLADWKSAGVAVTLVIHPKHAEWKGLVGYVQNFLPPKMVGEKTVAYLCGMQAMLEQTRERLLERGVRAENILGN